MKVLVTTEPVVPVRPKIQHLTLIVSAEEAAFIAALAGRTGNDVWNEAKQGALGTFSSQTTGDYRKAIESIESAFPIADQLYHKIRNAINTQSNQ